jgi:hypothetical protein
VKFPFQYQRPAWGGAARAVPGGSAGNRERSPSVAPGVYPAARERSPGARPSAALKYARLDGTSADVTLGDTDSVVVIFAGRPDVIWLTARAFGAMFTLTNRVRSETTTIMVPAGQVIEVHASRDTVLGRNCEAGNNAIVTVVGGWAEPDELTGLE